jgi:hypothetical protein
VRLGSSVGGMAAGCSRTPPVSEGLLPLGLVDDKASTARHRVGCYPGSFNPPTVAHLAVAEAAVDAGRLARLDLVLSTVALGKADLDQPSVAERAEVLRTVAETRPWLGVAITEDGLIADIAAAYDVVVMGADKWRQVTDPSWYGIGPADRAAISARDRALRTLPEVLVVPRAGDRPDDVTLLEVDDVHHQVSASAIRAGAGHARAWMLPEAAAHAVRTGAWPTP